MRTVYKDHVALQEVKAEDDGGSTTTVRIQKLEKELADTNQSLHVDWKTHEQEVQKLWAQLWDKTTSKSSQTAIAIQDGLPINSKRPASNRKEPSSKHIKVNIDSSLEVEAIPTVEAASSNGYYKCLVPDPTDPSILRYMKQ